MKRFIRCNPALVLASILLAAVVAAPAALARDRKIDPITVVDVPLDEALPELDEVLVNGRRLAERINAAEDAFFALYNKLNRKNTYDMYCGLVPMQVGSRIMLRGCAPGFLFEDYGAPPDSGYGICVGDPHNNGSSVVSASACFGTGYVPPSRELVLLERKDKWAAHMLQVINSDAHLLDLATNLAVLYDEMLRVRSRFHPQYAFTLPGEPRPATQWKVRRTGPGPRAP